MHNGHDAVTTCEHQGSHADAVNSIYIGMQTDRELGDRQRPAVRCDHQDSCPVLAPRLDASAILQHLLEFNKVPLPAEEQQVRVCAWVPRHTCQGRNGEGFIGSHLHR